MAAPILNFEFLGPCFYELGEMRPPLAGEYYLSGAIVSAWRAYSDLTPCYRIVRPTFKAVLRPSYVRGEAIPNPSIATKRKESNS